jgi:lipoprotein-anchoring transpeptidase ErfK/SrfK
MPSLLICLSRLKQKGTFYQLSSYYRCSNLFMISRMDSIMVRKYLCVGTLIFTLLLQSATASIAESNKSKEFQLTKSIQSATQYSTDVKDSTLELQTNEEEFNFLLEQLKKDQEQLKIDQEQLKKTQAQLKKIQEQLNISLEEFMSAQQQLKKNQDQLRIDQEQLKKDQDMLAVQNSFKKLNLDINSNTYLSYLKKLGYYKKIYKNDEKLNIRNTLLLFQSDHNMSVTGKWDNSTKAVLINRLVSSDFTYLDTVKEAPTNSKWIVINKTKRILTLYEDTKVIKKYAVAVGNPSSLTKSGKFIITSKLIDPDWGGGGFAKPVKGGIPQNPLGSRWLGINRTDGSYGIHGTNSFYSIGTYASHGCIRMQNYCVEELFPLVPMKANVWVGTQTELKKWGITQNTFEAQGSAS